MLQLSLAAVPPQLSAVSILKLRRRESVGSKRRPSAVASVRKGCPKACCATMFMSRTVPHGDTEMFSPRPLDKRHEVPMGRRQRLGICLTCPLAIHCLPLLEHHCCVSPLAGGFMLMFNPIGDDIPLGHCIK